MDAVRAAHPGKRIELWFQDEARVGQKNKLTRRWARRGARPRAPHDQRTAWAYLFGAICPAEGKGAGLVMPFCDTPAMQAHLLEISAMVAPDAHAILILDQAGWHLAGALVVPENIMLLPLPPRSPELNPVENVWQFLRDNWLSNRVFTGYDEVLSREWWKFAADDLRCDKSYVIKRRDQWPWRRAAPRASPTRQPCA